MLSKTNLSLSASPYTFLAIDSAFDICSVALVTPDYTDYRCSEVSKKHADDVLPIIDSLLSDHQLALVSIDFIAMVSGPGSFTGLRIGAAVVQGLAFGANLPVVCVSSLAMMARAVRHQTDAGKISLICLHAREAEFYFAAYKDDLVDAPEALISDTILSPEQITLSIGNLLLRSETREEPRLVLTGSGWQHELLLPLLPNQEIRLVSVDTDARVLAELAIQNFRAGRALEAAEATPVYLKDDMEYRTA